MDSLKNPTEDELDLVAKKTGINKDMLRISMDEEETAHIDFENGVTMLIVDTRLSTAITNQANTSQPRLVSFSMKTISSRFA